MQDKWEGLPLNIEELVKNMLQTIVPNVNKRILIFLTGGTVNAEILLNILADYDGHQYDIVISESGRESLSEAAVEALKGNRLNSFSELKDALKKADFILIPVMTRNTLAKAALGIEDNLVTTGIARALMSNKEVFAVKDSFSSEHPINKAMDLAHNAAYNAMLKSYEYQLETFGLKFIELEEFKTVIQNKRGTDFAPKESSGLKAAELATETVTAHRKVKLDSSILTLGDLRGYENEEIIQVKANTIITPLAKDFININQVKLEWIHE